MRVGDWVKVIAGGFVLSSSLLGFFHNEKWLFVTMFVGANLFQYGFSGFCPLEIILKKLGVKE